MLLFSLLGAHYADEVEPSWLEVTQVSLKLPRLPKSFSGFRIVQISDIHLGYWMTPERFEGVLALVMQQSADLVAVTGDFVLTHVGMPPVEEKLSAFAQQMKRLTERSPAVAVLGNHDHWYNAVNVRAALEQGGVQVLTNSVFTLERSGESFHVAGVDDVYVAQNNLDAVLKQLPDSGGAMLLAHEPDFADVSAATGRFDLQISGHSHGGQIVLPFIGPPILPHLGQKYPLGLYKVGNMFQYTNRGVGMTMPTVRFNCRPEITVFTLESA